MISRACLLDLYADRDSMVLWFRLELGELLRLTDSFSYRFYARGPKPVLQALVKKLAPYIRRTEWTRRQEFWSGEIIPVMEITLRFLEKQPEVLRLIGTGWEGLTFYNCDLAIPQYYGWEKGLFPLCTCEIEWDRAALRESGLEGILFLARLTRLPAQTLARATPGTAITSMQLDRALEKGILIPWKKGRPETFKTAWDLLVADKGCHVLQPPIGLWEQVAEIDFVSMYPSIMVQHNLSPETMLCRCCPDPVVPKPVIISVTNAKDWYPKHWSRSCNFDPSLRAGAGRGTRKSPAMIPCRRPLNGSW
jgi:hypothetical protein